MAEHDDVPAPGAGAPGETGGLGDAAARRAAALRERLTSSGSTGRAWSWHLPFKRDPDDDRPIPTTWARGRAAGVVREVAQKGVLDHLLRAEVRVRVEGLDLFDRIDMPVLFAPNHCSHMDTALLLCTLPDRWRRRTTVAAASDYFFRTWIRGGGSALVFNTFPMRRGSGGMGQDPGELLDQRYNILLYPEGTRSTDGSLRRFQLGMAWMAVEYRTPVVPVAIHGTFESMPKGRGWPRPGRLPVLIRFGEPLLPAEGEGIRHFGPRLRQAVEDLLAVDAEEFRSQHRQAVAAARDSRSARIRRALRIGSRS